MNEEKEKKIARRVDQILVDLAACDTLLMEKRDDLDNALVISGAENIARKEVLEGKVT